MQTLYEALWPLLLLAATALVRALVAHFAPVRQRYTVQLTLDSHARIAFAIDVTGSMSTRDCPDGLTRLEYACRCIQYLVDTAPPELRRVDILAFGTTVRFWGEIQRDEVAPLLARLTACESQTYTAAVVRKAARMLVPGRTGALVIWTDGEPQDPAELTLALSSAPMLEACAVSVGRVRLDCALARAEDTLFAWGPRVAPLAPRLEPDEPEVTTPQWAPPPLPSTPPRARRTLKHAPPAPPNKPKPKP